MTMPYGSTEEPDVEVIGHQSVPVHLASSDLKPSRQSASEFGQTRTIVVANVVGPLSVTPGAQRVLNRSQRRHEARISVLASVTGAPGGSSTSVAGNVTAPGAGVTIATTAALPAGTYTVAGTNTLLGAAAVGDLNNFGLFVGATQVGTLAASNNAIPYGPITVSNPTGAAISIRAIAAGTAGIVYVSQLTATLNATGAQSPLDGAIFGAPGVIQAGTPAAIGALGGFLPIGKDLVWKSQAELWVCYPVANVAPVYVTVTDFQWATSPDAYKEKR